MIKLFRFENHLSKSKVKWRESSKILKCYFSGTNLDMVLLIRQISYVEIKHVNDVVVVLIQNGSLYNLYPFKYIFLWKD